MRHTSLQNIVSKNLKQLEQSQIQKFFQTQTFPRFELQDLRAKPQLMRKQSYVSFLKTLEQWNKLVGNPTRDLKQCEYRINQFIFSWLKWLGVQSSRTIDSSLLQLQNWYNFSRDKEPIISMSKCNLTKSSAQDWEIRSSYRSNLPRELENYKRRVVLQIRNGENTPKTSQQKEKGQPEKVAMNPLHEARISKKENIYLRQAREQQAMADYVSAFKRSKVQFHKSLTKNFYKQEFSRDKLEFEPSKIKLNSTKSSLIKGYRLKTSGQGFSQHNSTVNQSDLLPSYHSKNYRYLSSISKQTDITTAIPESKSLNTSSIDGLGLLANPFEVKLKKKKRA